MVLRVRYGMFLCINTLRLRRNGQHFADDNFKRILLDENIWILIWISLNFVPKGSINNIPASVQIMAWCWPGDKPLSRPMMVILLTHICVTRPQWVKSVICVLPLSRDHSLYGISQWETTLHCNVVSHWLSSVINDLFCLDWVIMLLKYIHMKTTPQ